MNAKNNKILGMKRNAAIAATILVGAALPFFLKTCAPQHETIVQIVSLAKPCNCGDTTAIDSTRHVGKTADTLVISQKCISPNKAPEPPKPPKKAKKKEKAAVLAPPPVEKAKPAEGCIPCAEAMYAPNTNGESVHMMISTAMTGSHANDIKRIFAGGEKVAVKCKVTVGSSSNVESVAYTVYKDGVDVTNKGNIASIIGVNPIGFTVSYPGASCCTFNFTVTLP